MKRIIGLVIAFILLMSISCLAVTLPAKPNDYTYDAANVIKPLTKDVIRVNNEALEKATGAQIAIVTLKSTGTYSTRDYAYMLINDWGVGDAKKNNGVMFLLVLRDGDEDGYQLVTGTGAEVIINTITADDLLTDYFDPYYATMDYDYGVLSLFEAVFCKVRDYYGLNLAYLDAQAVANMTGTDYSRAPAPATRSEGGFSVGYIILIVVVIIVISSMGGRRRRRRGGVAVPPPPIRRAPRVVVRPAVRPRPFGGFGGPRPSGGFGASRPSGGFSSSRPSGGFGSSRSSGGSRGSFGGFGGGSSRGGGAGRGR